MKENVILSKNEYETLKKNGIVWFEDGSHIIDSVNGFIHMRNKKESGNICTITIKESKEG